MRHHLLLWTLIYIFSLSDSTFLSSQIDSKVQYLKNTQMYTFRLLNMDKNVSGVFMGFNCPECQGISSKVYIRDSKGNSLVNLYQNGNYWISSETMYSSAQIFYFPANITVEFCTNSRIIDLQVWYYLDRMNSSSSCNSASSNMCDLLSASYCWKSEMLNISEHRTLDRYNYIVTPTNSTNGCLALAIRKSYISSKTQGPNTQSEDTESWKIALGAIGGVIGLLWLITYVSIMIRRKRTSGKFNPEATDCVHAFCISVFCFLGCICSGGECIDDGGNNNNSGNCCGDKNTTVQTKDPVPSKLAAQNASSADTPPKYAELENYRQPPAYNQI